MGPSISTAKSSVEVDSTVINQYSGTCDFECDNSIQDVYVDLVNVDLQGGLTITQQCSVDGTCSISTSIDSLVDTAAKATSSTNAKDTGLLQGILDKASSESKVKISDYLQNQVYDTCKVASTNDIRNLAIFAANSKIQGGILISQAGNVVGNCTFQTVIKNVQKATGDANASATSGKDKKGEKCGSCSNIGIAVAYIVVGVVVIVLLGGVAYGIYRFSNRSSGAGTGSSTTPSVTSRAFGALLRKPSE
jgi:hypothetical protein